MRGHCLAVVLDLFRHLVHSHGHWNPQPACHAVRCRGAIVIVAAAELAEEADALSSISTAWNILPEGTGSGSLIVQLDPVPLEMSRTQLLTE